MLPPPADDLPSQVDRLLRTAQPLPADLEQLGWALKNAVQAAWVVDPTQAESNCAALHRLHAAAPTPTMSALADWSGGIVHLAQGQLEPALSRLSAAIDSWQQLGRELQAAQVSVAQLMPLALLGRFDEALDRGQAAELALMRHDDPQGAAKVALNLGSLSMQRGRYAQAAEHYRRAAVRFARAGDREHSVMADVGLADARSYEGRLDEAARIYDRAEMRARRHALPVLAASAEHGRALLALGAGRYRSALAGLVRVQTAFSRFEVDHYLTEVERDLADAYLELCLLPEALAIYDKLVDRLTVQGNAATLPWLMTQRARTLARAGQTPAALRGLQAAAQQFVHQGNAAGQAQATLALLELQLGQADDGADLAPLLHRAAALGAELPAHLIWRARLVQAAALRRLGRHGDVLDLLQPQAGPAQAVWGPAGRPRQWDEIGRAHAALGQRRAAAQAFEQAIELFEQMRTALPGEEFQLAVLADHLHPYQARLAIALEHEAPEWVLAWLERHRARVLSERLGRGHEDDRPEPDTDQALPMRRLRLNWIRRQARRRAEDGDDELPETLHAEAAQIELDLLEQARRDRLAQTEGTLPKRQRLGVDGLDLAALRRRFDGPRALIEYGLHDDELFAVVIAQGRIRVQRSLASWRQVQRDLQRLRFQIDTLRAGEVRLRAHASQLMQRCTQRLQALHAAVWAPLLPLLAAAEDVVIVPCDALQALPFAALHDGLGWLDERVRTTLAPSAALAPGGSGPSGPPRAVVVGEGLRLDHMRHEVAAVAGELDASVVLMDGMATVDAVLSAARTADVLHLACHGEFRGDNPRFSALHLGDGLLSAAQVEAQPLSARLVVLSACETGRSLAAPGDESLGLVRAFQLAGARDVVASLWAVDDEATAHFMSAFYRSWNHGGRDVASALQQARVVLRQRWPHPFHWAAFNLYARADL